jgi:hypothetical protein
VLVIVLAVSNLLAILPVSLAQTKPAKPAIPTFTVQAIDNSHFIPPSATNTIDPYSGKEKTITKSAKFVDNTTILVKIKNQPFTEYPDDYTKVTLWYKCWYKGHYSNDGWQEVSGGSWENRFGQSRDSEYTTISFEIKRQYNSGETVKFDVQVKAMLYVSTVVSTHDMWGRMNPTYEHEWVEGKWSSTQTVTFYPLTSSPDSSTPSNISPSNPDSSIPNQPDTETTIFGLALWIGTALVVLFSAIVVLLTIIVVYLRKKSVAQFNSSLDQMCNCSVYVEKA